MILLLTRYSECTVIVQEGYHLVHRKFPLMAILGTTTASDMYLLGTAKETILYNRRKKLTNIHIEKEQHPHYRDVALSAFNILNSSSLKKVHTNVSVIPWP